MSLVSVQLLLVPDRVTVSLVFLMTMTCSLSLDRINIPTGALVSVVVFSSSNTCDIHHCYTSCHACEGACVVTSPWPHVYCLMIKSVDMGTITTELQIHDGPVCCVSASDARRLKLQQLHHHETLQTTFETAQVPWRRSSRA